MMKVYALFGGTCRCFALVFLVCGIVLAFKGKLDGNYVTLAAGVQTLVVAHSIKEDYHERNNKDTSDKPDGG